LAKSRRAKKGARSHLVKFGPREIETRGLAQGFWTDLYHRAMTVYWPVFFGSAAAIFVALNATFALIYSLGDNPIANAGNRNALELFYFSIETLATVGYGDMHPQTNYGHAVATVEIFTGMCFLAVLTGLVFARFSRPRARFVFAQEAVVATHEGKPTLMVRMANARHNTISRANARLWLIRAERTAEGDELRRFYDLALDRTDHPMFVLSWMLFHVIDKTSPLYGIDAAEFQANDSMLILTVNGIDDSSAQLLYARHVYSWQDVRWHHRYRDITSISPGGRFLLDYTRFHDVVPEKD
jgi:inward rectifier potassium channel